MNKKCFEEVELEDEHFVTFAVADLLTLSLVEIEFVIQLNLMIEEYLRKNDYTKRELLFLFKLFTC